MALGRGWLWPAAAVSAVLALAYLPAHGVRDVLDLLASTAAALGLVALSVAAPRVAIRGVLHVRGPFQLIGGRISALDDPERRPAHRLLALAVSAAVSASGLAAAAALSAAIPAERSAHAVSLVVLAANAWLLFGNLVTAPPFGGWSLLLAVLDGLGTPRHRRLARARRIGRPSVLAVSLLLAAGAVAVGHLALLVVATLLAWYGWIATAVAEVDDMLDRYLERRRLGDLLRPATVQVDADEPVSELTASHRPTEVTLVFSRAGLIGAVGPRQLAGLPASAVRLRCEQIMVPLAELPILPATAPATDLLPLLRRHGFVLGWTGAGFGSIEEHDLLKQILVVADIRRRVADAVTDGKPGRH